ncbi:ABC transporter permease [Lacticaseibacillus paracasei subsp. paracasei]|uniref:ABC transporter permease n=1 Tax=Lacticaseibacillus paracasei TaxID=1597 RepID=UPI001E4371AB|nr:ABC transporter permease subunit [Lacticaseibacillus paracasei]MCD0434414.1 ABC transporter permease [Lacticaseibacillus paracasei subsp. paracasei]
MVTLVKQESYKLVKRPSLFVFWFGLTLFQVAIAVYLLTHPNASNPSSLFINSFYAPVLIVFYMLALTSTQLSSELQYGTLKSLLYRRYSSSKILASKWVTLLLCTLVLYASSLIMSLCLAITVFNGKIDLVAKGIKGQQVWQIWLMNNISLFLTLIFILSFVCLLATLFENSTPAIIIGLSTYFIVSIFNQLMFMMIKQHEWIKWNPVNMMNLGNQLQNAELSKLTRLPLSQISLGYLIYAAAFFALSLVVFKYRNER